MNEGHAAVDTRQWHGSDMDTVSCDTMRLKALHMKCQRQIARIRWQAHTRNTEVATLTDLSPVTSESIIQRRNSSLSEDTPAHQALQCHVDVTFDRPRQ